MLFICVIIIVLNKQGKRKLVNKNSDFTLAVANLAAAAIAANPKLTMEEAVQRAREILRGTSITQQQIDDSVQNDKIQCNVIPNFVRTRLTTNYEKLQCNHGVPTSFAR